MDKLAARPQAPRQDARLDRQAQLVRMADTLQAATAAADWAQLGEQVSTLAPQLRALAARGPWSAAEQSALRRLRAAHDGAQAAAAAAANALAVRLDELRANRDGWFAYALHGDAPSDAGTGMTHV